MTDWWKARGGRIRRSVWVFIFIAVAAISSVAVSCMYSVYSQQKRAHAALQAEMAEASREAQKVLREYLDRANLAADMVIANWRMDWSDPLDRPRRVELLKQSSRLFLEAFPEIVQIAIIRADGFSYPEDHPPNANFQTPVNLGDREHFKWIAVGGMRAHFGNRVLGRLSGVQTLQYAVAARDGQGALQMVVVVSIRTAVIPQAMITEAHGGVASAFLTWPNGKLIDSNIPGGDDVNANFSRHVDSFSSKFGGWFSSQKSPLDDIERYFYVSYVGRPSLFLAVGVDQIIVDKQKSELTRSIIIEYLWLFLWISVVFSLVIVLFYISLLYFIEKKLSSDLSSSTSLLMKFYDLNQEFVFLTVLNLKLIQVNKGFGNICHIMPRNLSDDLNYVKFQGVFEADNPGIFSRLDKMDVGSQMRDVLINVEAEQGRRTIKFDITKLNIEQKYSHGTSDVVGYLGYGRDYTSSLEDEAELSRLRLDLANVVRTGPGAPYRGNLSDDDIFTIDFPSGLGPLELVFASLKSDRSDPLGAMKEMGQRAMRTQFMKDLREHGQARARFPIAGANGEMTWIQDNCVTIERSANGLTLAGYYDDVTQLIRTELALEQSTQMARLGAITGGLSHELNQPLAAIAMAAENGQMILEDGAAGIAEATEKFSRIAGFAQRAATIIRDMRRFSSLEGAAVARTNLKSVIDSAILIMAAKIHGGNLDISVAVDVAVVPVSATYGLLEQVLVNLIANAVDAHASVPRPAGQRGWIAIRAAILPNDFVGLTVADDAGGFKSDIESLIFEPFFTTKGPSGGTGLGLSVSFGILKSWGGSMSARNSNGGAIFEMTLPTWKGVLS